MSGMVLVGGALVVGGVVTLIIAQFMPARTMPGAVIYAMLAAYRRTLQYTMAQSRSMVDVVQRANLAWLETPDQAVVWGVALGLNNDVEAVLQRSAEDLTQNRGPGWLPLWYGGAGYGYGGNSSFGGAAAGGLAPGLFSSGGLPDFGGMTAALGTIGVAPGSSGSSGGGFGGGGGGGGGGGAGGGF